MKTEQENHCPGFIFLTFLLRFQKQWSATCSICYETLKRQSIAVTKCLILTLKLQILANNIALRIKGDIFQDTDIMMHEQISEVPNRYSFADLPRQFSVCCKMRHVISILRTFPFPLINNLMYSPIHDIYIYTSCTLSSMIWKDVGLRWLHYVTKILAQKSPILNRFQFWYHFRWATFKTVNSLKNTLEEITYFQTFVKLCSIV